MTGGTTHDAGRSPTVAIVGAGVSGLAMAIALKRAGVDTFTIYEKADGLGGTWRDNTYPGLTCDTPSRCYSYSFALNPDWSRFYAPGPEIHRYLEGVADRFGVRDHIRFGTEVARAEYGADGRWRVALRDGEESEADFLVTACGVSHHPRIPDIPGLDTFAGPAFHSARWDHDAEVRGRRVGVVGTGSSGVQIVSAVSEVAGHLTHFQRTPQWVIPMPNPRYPEALRRLLRRSPVLQRAGYQVWQRWFEWSFGTAVVEPGVQRTVMAAMCRAHLRTVRDPELRRTLTPDHAPMCKRLVRSGSYYRAVQRPNVSAVRDEIERIEPEGVVTGDGRLHELDVLVLATGFQTHQYVRPIELVGEDGVTLDEVWRDGPTSYLSIALPGFPNFFMMVGPQSPYGNQSLFIAAEEAAAFVMRFVEMFRAGEMVAAAPTREAYERFNRDVVARMPATTWVSGCDSWYIGPSGIPEAWPWTPEAFRRAMLEPELDAFEVRAAPAVAAT